jgi:hypothetical protein
MDLRKMMSLTHKRQEAFVMIFNHLGNLKDPLIIETGCVRPINPAWGKKDSNGYPIPMTPEEQIPICLKDEGCSTILFDAYIKEYNGELHSVDINPEHVSYAESLVGDNATIHCDDSLNFLWTANKYLLEKNQYVDLLYLDSLDFDIHTYHVSPAHHLKELCAIISRLRKGSMLVVDDNYMDGNVRKGKGIFIMEFMEGIGIPLTYDGLQLIWKF